MRRGPMMKPGEKPSFKSIIRLFSYFRTKDVIMFFMVVACIATSALVNVKGSLFLQTLIDDYIKPIIASSNHVLDSNNPIFMGMLDAMKTMCLIYAVGVVCMYLRALLMATITQNVLKKVRDDMFVHMQTLPIRYFDTHTFGDVMSHYTNDTDALRQLFSQSLPQMLTSLITIISVFTAMLTLSWQLTLVVVFFVGIMFTVTATISGKSAKFFMAQQKSLGATNGYIEEMINGQKVVKVFCHEEEAKEKFDEKNEELFKNASTANALGNLMMPINANIGNMEYIVIAVLGGFLAISGKAGLTTGMIVSFLTLSKSFNMPIQEVSMQINSVVMAIAGGQRIFQLMDEQPEEDDGKVTLVYAKKEKDGTLSESKTPTRTWAWKHPHSDGRVVYTQLKGDIVFDHVDFSYDGEHQILHDISLYAKPGQKIALVGATGAGKTTITNLINRFYDIADGKIRYDGENINKIKKADLRKSLGIVLQDTNLFTGTVLDNIRYGKLDATDAECKFAACIANADGFIRRLPQGYDTILENNGANLSQGQRQLIAIARAAVADPPVMILDEATSSIDTRTELIVQKGMDALMKGRTVFVIAHRLSTVQNSNVILVIDHGRIIEKGSHEELLALKGQYYNLYTGSVELE